MIISLLESFSILVLVGGFSLETERQQVTSGRSRGLFSVFNTAVVWMIISLLESFSTLVLVGGFSLETERQQVTSGRSLGLFSVFNTAVVWMVSILTLISCSSLFFKPLKTVLSSPITGRGSKIRNILV